MSAGPLPVPRGEENAWFEAAAEGWLALGRCTACGAWFLPRVVCPSCWSQDVEIAKASGRGVVHSFTVLHRAGLPEFAERVPYVVALTEIEEGVRLVTNLVDVDPPNVQIDMAVEVTFEDIGGLTVPQFRPAA